MTIHEIRTTLTPAEVIDRACAFFPHAGSSYAAFVERVGDSYIKLHLEVGEIIIAAVARDGFTWVRGTASRGVHLLSRFLTTLAAPLDTYETVQRYGQRRVFAAHTENTRALSAGDSGQAKAA